PPASPPSWSFGFASAGVTSPSASFAVAPGARSITSIAESYFDHTCSGLVKVPLKQITYCDEIEFSFEAMSALTEADVAPADDRSVTEHAGSTPVANPVGVAG